MVVIDREQGGREALEDLGVKVHALATVTDLMNALLELGLIDVDKYREVVEYTRSFKRS